MVVHSRMRPSWHRSWLANALVIDTCAVVLALAAAAVLRFGLEGALDVAEPRFSAPWPFAAPIWIGAMAAFGLYSQTRCANAVEEARQLMGASFAAPVGFVLLAFLAKQQEPSRLWIGASTLLALVAVGVGRRILRQLGAWHRRHGRWSTRVVIVGRQEAKRLVDALVDNPAAGYTPVATCGFQWNELPSGEFDEVETILRDSRASAVLVVSEDMRRDEVSRAIAVADKNPVSVVVLPGLDFTLAHSLHVVPVAEEPGLALESPALHSYQRVLKRGLDLSLSTVGLLLALPVATLIAMGVKLDSPGPILFNQKRVGRDGRMFRCLKFRTMVKGAEELDETHLVTDRDWGFLAKRVTDPRITRVGRLLRRTSLDELPQLLNVLRGEMSLVGPRPLRPGEGMESDAIVRRLHMRPGITGLWQVNGRSEVPPEERVRFDLTYVQNWSLLVDLYIIARTIPAVLSGRGAA
ncbi:MAG: sugar transferase [Actinomycetota bacterium]